MREDKGIEKYRYFLKDSLRFKVDFSKTDQSRGVKPPPIEKPYSDESKRIKLSKPEDWKNIGDMSIIEAIKSRKSRRKYLDKAMSLEEVSFLLWATQGVRKHIGNIALRNVPSAGNRHAFETYLCVLKVSGLDAGIYRYLPLEHELLFEFRKGNREELAEKIGIAALGQYFVGSSALVFVWAAIPYRTEWRYGIASHKVIAIDAGHVCQNLYAACEYINAGTCAIAAYDQELMDALVQVDGKEEYVIYLAPVGKIG